MSLTYYWLLTVHRSSDYLVIVDTSVKLNKDAVRSSSSWSAALDSVPAGSDTRLYFLGIRDLDSKRLLKIMIREARTSVGLDYAIRYAISSR